MLSYYDSVVGAGGSLGTVIYNEYIGSSGSAQQRSPGSGTRTNEMILKKNTNYILEFTPDSDNCKISINVSWYEH